MRRVLVVALLVVTGCSFSGRAGSDDTSADDVGDDVGPQDGPIVIDGPGEDEDAPVADAGDPDAAAPDASAPDASPGCPTSYEVHDGSASAYRVEQNVKTWPDAEADCEDDGVGTHLVILDSNAEYAVVNPLFFGQLWVGVSDRVTEGTWLTVTGGAPAYLPWSPGEPNDLFGEDCVRVGDGGGAVDIDCVSELRGFVCECDGAAPDPASY